MGKKEVISMNTNSSVYKYYSKKYRRTVVKKVLRTSAQEKMERFKKEPSFLEQLKNNENVIQLICYRYTNPNPNTYECKIITEYYEKGNLRNYIISLKREGLEFGDRVLEYIIKFVKFFAALQRQNISHRDIKPENIFVTGDGQLKIGDFGCSTLTDDRDEFTIQGTLYFLSPELRIGYVKFIQRIGGYKIRHCPYKSDVFSLGLVFLTMATMENLDDTFARIEDLQNSIKKRISKIGNSDINEIIQKMLTIDAIYRPDFVELNEIIENRFRNICHLCKRSASFNQLNCDKCEIVVHGDSCAGEKCSRCGDFYSGSCSRCNEKCFKFRRCSHLLCDSCAGRNYNCDECFNTLHLGKQSPVYTFFPVTYICIYDKINCELQADSKSYRCPVCLKHYCSICKQMHDEEIKCLDNRAAIVLACKCKRKIDIQDFESIFYLCEGPCGFRCIVCLKSINADHTTCCKYFLN